MLQPSLTLRISKASFGYDLMTVKTHRKVLQILASNIGNLLCLEYIEKQPRFSYHCLNHKFYPGTY